MAYDKERWYWLGGKDRGAEDKIQKRYEEYLQKKKEGQERDMALTVLQSTWKDMEEEFIEYSHHDFKNIVDDEKNEDYVAPIETIQFKQNPKLQVPSKIDLYEGLDIMDKDNVQIFFDSSLGKIDVRVFLVNGDSHICGILYIKRVKTEENEERFLLVTESDFIDFNNHNSTKYYFAFLAENGSTAIKVPVEVNYQKTQITNTHLCIDFGTSNTTAGCYLDEHYVGNISNLAVINGNVAFNTDNTTKFIDEQAGILSFRTMVPTIVYVNNCSNPDNIEFSFGYRASEKIKMDNYCPNASCFMEIKRWTSHIDKIEEIQDADGNKANVSRKTIIAHYLLYIIRMSENQFKCKFRNIHISAPVKLKDKVLSIYQEILKSYGYTLEIDHAIDEGIAVLYSIINNQIKENNYQNGEPEQALIIDCGGGTSDLASCEYIINKDEDGIINLDIKTEYMNGDVNFGGNNLTYRIMQYMKIIYAGYYTNDKNMRIKIDNLIDINTNLIFSYIEGELDSDTDENVSRRYREVYARLEEEYKKAEQIIPTKFREYENSTKAVYNKVKNNFYFLWKLAEEMKKEFYKTTSIARYKFEGASEKSNADIDLHINRIDNWRISVMENSQLIEKQYPEIIFMSKEIDKLLRGDIYYLVRKFLNKLYETETLYKYSQIKLSGQSSKIDIYMDSLKEFLPGKKIKSGKVRSKNDDAEELKLLCLRGAVTYLHALTKSNIEVNLKNTTKNIPISVYVKNENDLETELIKQGDDWKQLSVRRRITNAGKEVYLYLKNSDKEIGEPYIYSYEHVKYQKTTLEELERLSSNRITQEQTDYLPEEKRYIFVYLNQDKWGFDIMPLYKDSQGSFMRGPVEFCSFEMDILQETFFDGDK
ncbi:MAG: hypothetical protein K0S47_4331 [Herbinix sp.]|nr:hypothetical protein [Herbinix sp.]